MTTIARIISEGVALLERDKANKAKKNAWVTKKGYQYTYDNGDWPPPQHLGDKYHRKAGRYSIRRQQGDDKLADKEKAEGIVQVRRPNSDKDRAHLQAAKRTGDYDQSKMVQVRKKDAPRPAAPEPEARKEPTADELYTRMKSKLNARKADDSEQDKDKQKKFVKWLSSPGKARQESIKRGGAPLGERTFPDAQALADHHAKRVQVHQQMAGALSQLAKGKSKREADALKRQANRRKKLVKVYQARLPQAQPQ